MYYFFLIPVKHFLFNFRQTAVHWLCNIKACLVLDVVYLTGGTHCVLVISWRRYGEVLAPGGSLIPTVTQCQTMCKMFEKE